MRNQNTPKKDQAGFTLIELLMVISIIALLSSMMTYALVSARRSGRDTRRIADLHQLDTALQTYIIDNGHAPYIGTCSADNPSVDCFVTDSNWGALNNDLKLYASKLPKDPCGTACTGDVYQYVYHAPGYEAAQCGPKCPLSTTELNDSYAIYARTMEKQGPYGYSHGYADSF